MSVGATEIFTVAGVAFRTMGSSGSLSGRNFSPEKVIYFIAGIGFEAIDVTPKVPYLISGIAFESASWKIGVIYVITLLVVLGLLSILFSPQPTIQKRSQKKPISRTPSRNSLDQSPPYSSPRPYGYPSPSLSRVSAREELFVILGSPR